MAALWLNATGRALKSGVLPREGFRPGRARASALAARGLLPWLPHSKTQLTGMVTLNHSSAGHAKGNRLRKNTKIHGESAGRVAVYLNFYGVKRKHLYFMTLIMGHIRTS